MTMTQKPQKAKARRGLCMAAGGLIDPNGSDYDAMNAEKTARWAAEDAAKQVPRGPQNGYQGQAPDYPEDPMQRASLAQQALAPAAAPETTFDQDMKARHANIVGLRDRLTGMEQDGRRNALMGAQSSIGFADGAIDVEALLAKSRATYGGVPTAQAAPAPTPVQAAPVQAAPAAPAPTGIRGWAVRNIPAAATLLNRGQQIDNTTNPMGKRGAATSAATGAATGAVGVDGMIRGPGTAHSDSIQASIGGTQFNVANGEKLAILPAKVAKNPEALDQIEEIIEGETGKPVNRGLRSGGGYAFGDLPDAPKLNLELDDATRADFARKANSRVLQDNFFDPRTAQYARATGGMSPEAAAFSNVQPASSTATTAPRVVGAGAAPTPDVLPVRPVRTATGVDPLATQTAQARRAAPAAAPAQPDMLAPDSVTPKAATVEPARTGIGGQWDAIKAKASSLIPGSNATQQAAKAVKPPAVVNGESIGRGVVSQMKPGSGSARLAAADFALRSGNHWDATGGGDDSGNGGIGFMDKGQIVARDLVNTGAGLVGGVVGGGVGALAGNTAGLPGRLVGGVAGGIAGANKAAEWSDSAMGGVRRGLNWANGQLGGDENYWKDSDANIGKQNQFLQTQPGYEESGIQRNSKKATEAIGSLLEKTGLVKRSGSTGTPTTTAPAPAAGGAQVGDPATAPTPSAAVGQLRDAGASGDVRGDLSLKEVKASTGTAPSTPAQGIRQLSTVNGGVYAGRDKSGQLNITNDPSEAPTQAAQASEAARAKEATRMQADLARQNDYFTSRGIESDLKSNFEGDRARGLLAQTKRSQDQTNAVAQQHNALTSRGQDVQLLGHQLDTQAKMAALQNTQQQQNLENNVKTIDNIFGGPTIKGPDGKEMQNVDRQDFITKMTKTLGEHGRTMAHLSPQDLVSFHNAYQGDKNGKNGTFAQFYNNWIDGHPDVEDYNPYRTTERADGEAGKTNALGRYRDRNGVLRSERNVTGRQFLTGGYDANIKRQIDNR